MIEALSDQSEPELRMGDGIAEIIEGAGDVLDQPEQSARYGAEEGEATLFLHVSPGGLCCGGSGTRPIGRTARVTQLEKDPPPVSGGSG